MISSLVSSMISSLKFQRQHATDRVVDQVQFERLLTLEYRRSERTGGRFALILIDMSGSVRDGEGPSFAGIALTLSAATRETDVTGWYRFPSTLGVILTTINGTDRKTIEATVVRRIRNLLSGSLGAEAAELVRVSCYLFPQEQEDDGSPSGGDSESTFPVGARRAKSRSMSLKRAVDVSGSLAALVLLAPVFAVVAALIKLTSQGPVFFRQMRVGQSGRRFTLLKFRSMSIDSDPRIHEEFVTRFIDRKHPEPGGLFKIPNDPRVTPLGRMLRKASLDELPQFLNVLRGDMSLVGPRPPIPYELEKYSLWHLRRIQDAKPGITGAWQVDGRSRTTFDEMVRMDLRYIRDQSFWLDLKILLKTPFAVLSGEGAH